LLNIHSEKPIVSIGLPVYNGEKFIRRRIDSILSQTLKNFQLIISDNCSTDSTSGICKDYAKKNKQIRYIYQEQKIKPWNNFQLVLQEAKCKYFVWAAVDDIWLNEFLEKNIRILESEEKFVGSISKIEYFDEKGTINGINAPDTKIRINSYDNYPKSGNFNERVRFYLQLGRSENFYSVFRTEAIKKNNVNKQMIGLDKAVILSVLRYGQINIINEVLMRRFAGGISTSNLGIKRIHLLNEHGITGKLFPFLPFTFWCVKNLGLKVFIENLGYFIQNNKKYEKFLIRYFKIKYLYTNNLLLPKRIKKLIKYNENLIKTNSIFCSQLQNLVEKFSTNNKDREQNLFPINEITKLINDSTIIQITTFQKFLQQKNMDEPTDIMHDYIEYCKDLQVTCKKLQGNRLKLRSELKKLNELIRMRDRSR